MLLFCLKSFCIGPYLAKKEKYISLNICKNEYWSVNPFCLFLLQAQNPGRLDKSVLFVHQKILEHYYRFDIFKRNKISSSYFWGFGGCALSCTNSIKIYLLKPCYGICSNVSTPTKSI